MTERFKTEQKEFWAGEFGSKYIGRNDGAQLLVSNLNYFSLVCEYYSTTPVTITYRGHLDRLFKRDFVGEMLEKFPDLNLDDYGFAYIRDQAFQQDDIPWLLMEKR